MILRDQLIRIGTYNKAHGVNGEINASLLVDAQVLGQLTCLVSDMEGIFVPFFVTAMRPKGHESALLTIDGMTTDGQVAELVNKDIYALKRDYDKLATRHAAGDEDQLPVDYLIGFDIADNGQVVGQVVGVDDTTDNVLFEVRRADGSMVHVPVADDLILGIDLDNRLIDMDMPQGLLEL